MINDSTHWKAEMRVIARRMVKRLEQKSWSERSLFLLERDVFFAFFSVRKLIEAGKLSKSIIEMPISVNVFPATGKNVTKLNNHKIDELFHLSKKQPKILQLHTVCNQFVHSYIFMPVFGENDTLESIFFSSDYRRNVQLYELNVSEIVRCLLTVALDDPLEIHMVFNEDRRDYVVTVISEVSAESIP